MEPAGQPPARHTVVVAPDRSWFMAWCLDNERNPRDRALICVTGPMDEPKLQGLVDFDVVNLGPCHRYSQVMAYIEHRQSRMQRTDRSSTTGGD